MFSSRTLSVWGWVQLFRPPNLFTVPGDVLAGYALSGMLGSGDHRSVAALAVISLLLYMGGLALNDWFDRSLDAVERPQRPIPAGAVSAHAVGIAGIGFTSAAVMLAFVLAGRVAVTAMVLAVLVVTYNGIARKIPVIGVGVMAGCRAVNVILGASTSNLPADRAVFVWLAVGMMFVYVIIVSAIAAGEASRLPSRLHIVALLMTPILLFLSGLRGFFDPQCIGVWFVWMIFGANTVLIGRRLLRNTDIAKTSGYVGALIRNLIFMQAFWVAAGGATCLWIVSILLLWPLASLTGRWFYGS